MQLKKRRSIKSALSLATCSLLHAPFSAASPPLPANSALHDTILKVSAIVKDTEFQVSNMVYGELGRVVVNEFVVSAKRNITEDEYLKATYIVDVMSGPSPNGLPAIRGSEPDTFTLPSGTVITPDPDKAQTFEFLDTRSSVILAWQKPLSRLLKTISEFNFSNEYDYTSGGLSSLWNKESSDRLTTYSGGGAYTFNILNPVGGAHVGLTPITDQRTSRFEYLSEYDFMLGVTQVLSRKTLFQVNYTASVKSGYLTDPYKLLVFLDNEDLTPVNANPYYYEKRPTLRISHIAYFQLIQNIKNDVLRWSYRYFNDDWGVSSHATEIRYLFNIKEDMAIQLKYRYYMQSAADFYHYSLVDGEGPGINVSDVVGSPTELEYASADYRLGNLGSHAVGVKFSTYFLDRAARIDFRVEGIINRDKKNRFETVRALVVQLAGKIRF